MALSSWSFRSKASPVLASTTLATHWYRLMSEEKTKGHFLGIEGEIKFLFAIIASLGVWLIQGLMR